MTVWYWCEWHTSTLAMNDAWLMMTSKRRLVRNTVWSQRLHNSRFNVEDDIMNVYWPETPNCCVRFCFILSFPFYECCLHSIEPINEPSTESLPKKNKYISRILALLLFFCWFFCLFIDGSFFAFHSVRAGAILSQT